MLLMSLSGSGFLDFLSRSQNGEGRSGGLRTGFGHEVRVAVTHQAGDTRFSAEQQVPVGALWATPGADVVWEVAHFDVL
jgi:hypothetical protein